MISLFSQVVYLPCKGVEPGTWEWILKWCWLADGAVTQDVASVAVGLTIAAVVGVQLWNASKQPKA